MELTPVTSRRRTGSGGPNNALLTAIAKAYSWQDQLESGECEDLEDIAKANGVEGRFYQADLSATAGAFGCWPRMNDRIEPARHREAMVRFWMSLPWAFFAKTWRRHGIADVPRIAGILSTGRVWGASRGFEPLTPI